MPSNFASVLTAMVNRDHAAVSNLEVLFSELKRNGRESKLSKAKTKAQLRAEARAKEHQRTWAETPESGQLTRQQRRRNAILRGKQQVTVAKKRVAQQGGDPRLVRTPIDAAEVMRYTSTP